MNITFVASELCDLLQITRNTLKAIEKRGKLEERLEKIGWKLEKKYKDGRSNIYELQKIDLSRWDKIQNKYAIRNKIKHSTFSLERLQNLDKSCTSVIRNSSVKIAEKTARKYEKILVEEKVIKFEKEVYVRKDLINHTEEFVSFETYSAYWADHWFMKRSLDDLQNQLETGRISVRRYDQLTAEVYEKFDQAGTRMFKYNSYGEYLETKEIMSQILEKLNKRNTKRKNNDKGKDK